MFTPQTALEIPGEWKLHCNSILNIVTEISIFNIGVVIDSEYKNTRWRLVDRIISKSKISFVLDCYVSEVIVG